MAVFPLAGSVHSGISPRIQGALAAVRAGAGDHGVLQIVVFRQDAEVIVAGGRAFHFFFHQPTETSHELAPFMALPCLGIWLSNSSFEFIQVRIS